MTKAFLLQLILATFALGGCNVAERLANGATIEPSGAIIEPNGATIEPSGAIIEPNGVVIEPWAIDHHPVPLCEARAKHFHGTVTVPCEDIARQIAP